jgi:DNA-directed RNA polymerase specialized sigma24 family protein
MTELGYETVHTTINEIIGEFEVREIIKKVNALPTKAKHVLKLYALEGYKHREIEDILGISEGTSKSQFNRAKYLLQLSIQKDNG